MPPRPTYDWRYYRDQYVTSTMSLADLNRLPGAPSLAGLKKRSRTEDWPAQREAYVHRLSTTARENASTTEAEVAARHVRIARAMQGKALERLRDLDVNALSARDVVALLRDAADIERKALGLDTIRHVHLSKRPEDMTDDELRAAMREYGLSE
jgi:hypothetical protein